MNAPKTPDTEDEETLPNSPLLLIDILTPIVCTPAPSVSAGLNLQPNFQKGEVLIAPQLLEGVAGKEGTDFLQGRLQFSHKKIN